MNSQIPSRRPVVLVPACNRMLGQHPFHVAGQKYVDAVRLAGALPLVVPSARLDELDDLLDLADGVLLSGSPSNVHPSHFGEAVHDTSLPLDTARDALTLGLIPRIVARGMPMLAICRGFQETNVALGGSLHQAVQEQPGMRDHRADSTQPVEVQYGVSHTVNVEPDGWLARLLDAPEIAVNSLHGQGIHRLAPGLTVEARAPDGLVEAFSIIPPGEASSSATRWRRFQLGVQWHPEWLAASNPVSMALLHAFGAACQDYRDLHRPPSR